ncbi:hypothetical protein AB0L65_35925 [Nonomuraea sp. NPDC052116]|uniref:hypothetical protein n=1 Tax=Nonomuraea sp. NPDC052116 TaxID=3155665 RepID=UPI00344061A6
MEARLALTLRMVAGLTVPEIARAFLAQGTTMEQRITRAKAKIKAARIPYRVPSADDLPARVSGVLAVLFITLALHALLVVSEKGSPDTKLSPPSSSAAMLSTVAHCWTTSFRIAGCAFRVSVG